MKKTWFILASTGLVFSSCGNKKKQDNSEFHVHEDGNVHANDAREHENTAKPDQESFEVKAKTTRWVTNMLTKQVMTRIVNLEHK